MLLRFTTVARAGSTPVDLELTCPDGSTFGEVRARLAARSGTPIDGSAPARVGQVQLVDSSPLGLPPLLDGAVIQWGDAAAEPAGQSRGLLRLHVTAGPDAGRVIALGPGSHRVGRAAEAAVRLHDADLSRVHLQIDVHGGVASVLDLDSTNGSWLDGLRLMGQGRWQPGTRVGLGSSVLELAVDESASAATTFDGQGHVLVNRAPRSRTQPRIRTIRFPTRQERPSRQRVSLVAAAVPLGLAGVLAWVQHSATYLLFGLMAPAMMLGNIVSDRLGHRRTTRRTGARWTRDLDAANRELATALTDEATWRRRALPDCAELFEAASRPTTRLWERRLDDPDHLTLRIGLGRLASTFTVTHDGSAEPTSVPLVDDVPFGVSLADLGVLGVAGPRTEVDGLLRSLVAQVAGWHSPRDTRVVVLTADTEGLQSWDWAGWLPHLRDEASLSYRARIGALGRADQVRRRVAELEAVLDERTARREQPTSGGSHVRSVVVLDGASRLRAVPGVVRLLEDGPAADIFTICAERSRESLPGECAAVVHVGPTGTTVINPSGAVTRVIADRVGAGWAERFGRALAPLRDATPDEGSTMPDQVRLLDLLGDNAVDASRLAEAWTRTPRSTEAILGATADGTFTVDLRHDGPHLLIGGMTGSGKSELLRTLITSLAIANSPEHLGFVLVDYKGGSAFEECAALPHTLGLVTDLDPYLAERAMRSLTAELKRRERILRDVGARDIDDYLDRAAGRPLVARLVLVIDEFRMLADELPAFLDGVLRVAALGRSLGVHLVLATQRPAGVVTADIAANVNLRIALRVRDQADSEDVIEAREAAALSARTPGRAYARSGANPLVLFQSARVGGRVAPGPADGFAVDVLTPALLGDPGSRPEEGPGQAATDLAHLVAYTTQAAQFIGVGSSHRPWLPPLPDTITLDELATPVEGWHVPYAALDRPDEQAQVTLTWDLAHDTHLAIAGTLRSGRSTALRTIAASIACRFSPADVHLHAIDGGSGGLSALICLPHVGVVAPSDEPARGVRLLDRLANEVRRRRASLGAEGFGSLAEQHAHVAMADRLPYLVVLVDGWESVAAQWENVEHGRPLDLMHELLREGAAVGLKVVITGDRGILVSRMASYIRDKIILRLTDPADLMLAGVPVSAIPAHQPAGRGLRSSDQSEVQIALLGSDPSGPGQVAALRALAAGPASSRPHASGPPPMRIERLPERVTLDQLSGTQTSRAVGWALVGAGGDDAGPVGLDLLGTTTIVAGPPRSGRSTALRTMATSLAGGGASVVLVTSQQPRELATLLDDQPASFVLVDDVERLADTETEDVLLQWFKDPRRGRGGLVVAGSATDMTSTFRGLSVVARKSGQGILLNPTSYADGDLLGVRLAPLSTGPSLPGRGVLVRNGELTPVQVALG